MTLLRLSAASLLLAIAAATAAAAGDVPSAPAASPASEAATADAPPAIEVVHEGDGVADIWRREGVDFPAYGPDGAPVAPTVQRQALQALASAYDVQFVALHPAGADVPPPAGVLDICTTQSDCIGGHVVVRRVPVGNIAQYRLASAIGDAWLGGRGTGETSACGPEYRHALTYSADGRAWAVLMDYACGRFRLHRDGAAVAEGVSVEPMGRAELDALLAPAGAASAAGPGRD